jgi:hypothetical protein
MATSNLSCFTGIILFSLSCLACGTATSDAGAMPSGAAGTDASVTAAPAPDGSSDASSAAPDHDSGTCVSCESASGSYMGHPLTWACDYDAPASAFDTADNAFADSFNTWIIRCVSTDGQTIVTLWFNAAKQPGFQDTTTSNGYGVFMYSADPSDTTRYLQGGAPNQTKNHIVWTALASGEITGSFDAAWSNASDGKPYGNATGTFHVHTMPK